MGIAILYFLFLMLRHLLIGPRRDYKVSDLPAPPRAITGNRAQPVFGHTRLFTKYGGDLGLLFPPHWREWKWLPSWFSRRLSSVFSIFIWGQWRICVIGPERAKQVLEMPNLKDGWPWSGPPVTLLGKSCLPLMEEEEADFLMGLLNSPLSHANVLRYASDFADLAEQFMDDLISGKLHDKFDKGSDKRGNQSHPDLLQEETNTSHYNDETSHSYKIKWDAMRSYTLDLIDGPVFGMNKWNSSEQSHGEATTEQPDVNPYHEDEEKLPQRQRVMLWMDRLKAALCVVKFSMGPEWMYLWPLTEYGRACIGRNHLEKLISKHVAQRSDRIEHVRRKAGHFIRDFSTTPIPLYAMMENFYYRNETVMGYMNKQPGSRATRPRSQSESALFDSTRNSSIPPPPPSEWTPTLSPTAEDSSHSAPPVVDANNKSARSPSPPPPRPPKFNSMPTPNRMRSISSPQIMELSRKSPSNMKKPKASILDQILSQHDISGQGLSTAVATELSILLYMIMDAGNAWTAMALNLLSLNHNALALVQEEIHFLVGLYGKDKLFIPRVLGKMATVDALLWEAIRLCPPFCGGMKVTTETVVLEEDGVQIPKNANVFFCQPTDQPFDLAEAMGKKPQDLTLLYPNINMYVLYLVFTFTLLASRV